MAMSPETIARRKAARDYDKRMKKLISVERIASFHRTVCDQVVRIELDKFRDNPGSTVPQIIEFRHPTDAVTLANEFLEKMGFRPLRLTRNILNDKSPEFLIDINTPVYCDPGCESYHSM